MKKNVYLIFIALAFCFPLTLPSQQAGRIPGFGKSYKEKMDSLYSRVDRSSVKSGILYDRVLGYAGLDTFDEQDTSNSRHFYQAWNELYEASYDPDFSDLDDLNSIVDRTIAYDKVDVGVLHKKFDHLDPIARDSISRGEVRGLVKALRQKEVVLIAPLKERVWGSTISFHLSEKLIAEDSRNRIKECYIDFGNGRWEQVISDGILTKDEVKIAFEISGSKIIRAEGVFSDGKEFKSSSSIEITMSTQQALAYDGPKEDGEVKALISFKGYNESVAIKGKNKYRIFYHTDNGNTTPILKKPMILLDGFDPKDERQIEALDPGQNPNSPSFKDLMNIAGTTTNLLDILRAEGYDVVVVNHHKYTADENGQVIVGGGDFIERNAMVLVKLIQDLNLRLPAGSTEKLTIIGPSMGGLISRYALAYMEKNNLSHNTRLWLSFDSPHLGANIPLAVHQTLYFFGYIGGNVDSKATFDTELGSPAAKQMLIEQFGYQNNTAPFREQFLANLQSNGLANSNGFPMNLRKIALINGTTLGTKINSSGQEFINVVGKKLGIQVAEVITNFLPEYGQTIRTFKGEATRGAGISIYNATGSSNTTNKNPRGSMDIMPGAFYNTAEIIYEKFNDAFNKENVADNWKTLLKYHSFIPSVSSLAMKNSDFLWSTPLRRNLTCSGETPFDSYYAPATNEPHITLTSGNADWIMKEFGRLGQSPSPQLPAVRLLSSDLSGPTILCNGSSGTFSFSNCEAPGNASWGVSSNLQITGSTGQSVTVKAVSGTYSGNQSITATFANGISVTRTTWVGKPSYSGSTIISDVNSSSSYVYTYSNAVSFFVSTASGYANYQWTITSDQSCGATYSGPKFFANGNGTQATTSSNKISVNTGTCSGTFWIQCKAVNTCGDTYYSLRLFRVSETSGGGCTESTLSLSPNPSSGDLEALIINPPPCEAEALTLNSEEKDGLFVILNYEGEKVYEKMQRGKKVNLQLHKLDPGVYVVYYYYNNQELVYSRFIKE